MEIDTTDVSNDWTSVVDGPGGFFPEHPEEILNRGDYNKVRIMQGTVLDEGWLLLILQGINPNTITYETLVKEIIPGYLLKEDIQDPNGMITDAILHEYVPWPIIVSDHDQAMRVSNDMAGDYIMGAPSDRESKLHARNGATVFTYLFQYVMSYPPILNIPPEYGLHGIDLFYVFGVPQRLTNFTVCLPEPVGSCNNVDIVFSQRDVDMSEKMMTLWTNFAKHGEPTPDKEEQITELQTDHKWRPFTPEEPYCYILDEELSLIPAHNQRRSAFWNEFLPRIISLADPDRNRAHTVSEVPVPGHPEREKAGKVGIGDPHVTVVREANRQAEDGAWSVMTVYEEVTPSETWPLVGAVVVLFLAMISQLFAMKSASLS